jgi:hypothetical protein
MTTAFNIKSNSKNVLIDPNCKLIEMDIPIQQGDLISSLKSIILK